MPTTITFPVSSETPIGFVGKPETQTANTGTEIQLEVTGVKNTVAKITTLQSLETQKFPDWIDPSLPEKHKQATLEAFKDASKKLKTAVRAWENITDESLKNDTSFLFINGRWNINLQRCPRVLFNPQ